MLIALLLVCGCFEYRAQAVSPTPDGGNPGGNTAEGGSGALFSLTGGRNNTAIGSQALFSVTRGTQNTAVGAQALKNNVASRNTADGFQALVNNMSGFDNTATGWRALFKNSDGEGNTATGDSALYNNIDGSENTANGTNALLSNTTGENNTGIGSAALFYNTTGFVNTAVGILALQNNTTGSCNIAVGFDAGTNQGDNNIFIGSAPSEAVSNMIHIGQQFFSHNLFGFDHNPHTATFIAGISGTSVTGTPVVITGDGQLGVASSSERFKQNIKPMDNASELIFALKPVTFRYKQNIDSTRVPQFGLVAEDVAKVNPDLVILDRDGNPFTVRYDAVNAMLLNEFIKVHHKIEEQHDAIAELKSGMETLAAALKQQATEMQAMRAIADEQSASATGHESVASAAELVSRN